MSAFTGQYDLEKAQSLGADLFILKPFDDIFNIVRTADQIVPQEIKVKKVKPYPFPAVIDNGGVKVPVEILLLTARGFISRPTTKAIFQVGGSCKAGVSSSRAEIPSAQPVAGD